MVDPGQNVYECLKAEFKEEALGGLMDNEEHKKKIKDKLKIMFEEGELVNNKKNPLVAWAWLKTRALKIFSFCISYKTQKLI